MQRASVSLASGKKGLILEFLLLAAITLAGILLRFYKLGEWSFWGDEIFTLSLREDGFNYSIWRKSLATLLIQWTAAGLGPSEWSARLVPAVIGVVSIPVLYFPIRKLFGTATGLLACGLLAISTWHIYWSQNARFYILLLLFYSLSLLAFHHGIEEDRPWFLILSLLFLGLAARERLLALFMLPVVAAYLVLLKILRFPLPPGLRLRNVLLFFGPLSILAVLFVGPYIQDFDGWMSGFGTSNNTPIWLLAGVGYYAGILVVCMGAYGAWMLIARKNRAGLLLGLSAGLPLLILMAIAPFHYTANRYVFITLTSWIWLASLAIQELFQRVRGNTRILTAGLLAVLLFASLGDDFLYFRYQNGNRENWKAAYAYIDQHQQSGDRIFNSKPDIGKYYLNKKTYAYPVFHPPQAGQNATRMWFIEDMDSAWLYPEAHTWMHEHAQEVAIFDVHTYARNFRMRVYLYDPQVQDAD